MMNDDIIYKTKSPKDRQEITVIWHDLVGRRIPNKKWKQVHAITNYAGKIVMVYFPDLDMVHIPGGHIENGENLEETLKREVQEETGGYIIDWEPIGYQERIDANGNVDYQLRVYAKVQGIVDKKKDYDGKMVFTNLIEPAEFIKVWGWENPIGERIQQIVNEKMKEELSDSARTKIAESKEIVAMIKPILDKYGTVEFVGGYAWGTLYDRDIDISLWASQDNIRDNYKKIINELLGTKGVFEIKARNLLDYKNHTKGRDLNCMLIMAKIFNSTQHLWNIDVCMFNKDDPSVKPLPFDADTLAKIEHMSQKQQQLVRKTKELVTNSGLYLKGRSSADIYKKVVSGKINEPKDYIKYANDLVKKAQKQQIGLRSK